jgi:integrase
MSATQPITDVSENIIPLHQPIQPRLNPLDPAGKTASSATKHPKELFVYRGKKWRIFKRSPAPDANWWFYFEANKKRCGPWSLGSASKQHAIAEAKLKVDLHFAGREKELRASMQRPESGAACSTFGELFAVVDRLAIDADPKGRTSYVWGTRQVFQAALGLANPTDVDKLSLALVDAAHGEKFFAAVRQQTGGLVASEQGRAKRYARSCFVNCKALFSAVAVQSMTRDCGLRLPPTVEAFCKSQKLARFKVPKNADFQAPDQAILRATLRAWVKLGRRRAGEPPIDFARRNQFLAIGLMVSCGLRRGEVPQIKWKHFTTDAKGQPRLIAHEVKVKNKSEEIEVRPLGVFWRIMHRAIARHGWRGASEDYVLIQRVQTAGTSVRSPGLRFKRGGKCDREYFPFVHVSKWLRALGWRLMKTNHALRDCAASLVTMKFGLHRAQKFCRHSSIATTQAHYQRFVTEEGMDDPKHLAWLRWAK